MENTWIFYQKASDRGGLDLASTSTEPDRDLTVTDSVYDAVGLRTTDVDRTVIGLNRDN